MGFYLVIIFPHVNSIKEVTGCLYPLKTLFSGSINYPCIPGLNSNAAICWQDKREILEYLYIVYIYIHCNWNIFEIFPLCGFFFTWHSRITGNQEKEESKPSTSLPPPDASQRVDISQVTETTKVKIFSAGESNWILKSMIALVSWFDILLVKLFVILFALFSSVSDKTLMPTTTFGVFNNFNFIRYLFVMKK